MVNTLSYLGAAGSLRGIVVVLPYSEPHRGGFQTQQSMIHLDMVERTHKQLFCVPTCPHKKIRASFDK